jgi:4-hydroxy-2-oxoheptanedioate aldolase
LGNRVREKIASGGVVYGCFVPSTSALDVEIVAVAGFDFVILDGEHGLLSPETAYPMILAAESRGIEPFARIGQNERQVILKFLDAGVSGAMIPQVNTAAEAASALAATHYTPSGTRGLAGGRTFDWGLDRPAADVVTDLNSRMYTMLQFEHIDALAEVDAILDTPGLDILFVGPNDLAQSMGYPGQPGHPDVTAVADDVVAKARAKGIPLGTTAFSPEQAQSVVARGFSMVVHNTPGLLATAARAFITGAKAS